VLASPIAVPCPRSYYFVCPEPYLAMPKLQKLLAWLREMARESPEPPGVAAPAPHVAQPAAAAIRPRKPSGAAQRRH